MKELKLVADLHTHTIASDGAHTILEIAQIAKEKGLSIVGISDHSFYFNNIHSYLYVFAKRTPQNYNGIRIIKSVETNILLDGDSEISKDIVNFLDLVIIGFHDFGPEICNLGEKHYTDLLIKCIENNRVDIIAHPCLKEFPLDLEKVVKLASEEGIAVEINNTNLHEGKTDLLKLKQLLNLIQKYHCSILANSDGHNWGEIGCFDEIEKFINENDFDPNLFLNSSEEKVLKFIEDRKRLIR